MLLGNIPTFPPKAADIQPETPEPDQRSRQSCAGNGNGRDTGVSPASMGVLGFSPPVSGNPHRAAARRAQYTLAIPVAKGRND